MNTSTLSLSFDTNNINNFNDIVTYMSEIYIPKFFFSNSEIHSEREYTENNYTYFLKCRFDNIGYFYKDRIEYLSNNFKNVLINVEYKDDKKVIIQKFLNGQVISSKYINEDINDSEDTEYITIKKKFLINIVKKLNEVQEKINKIIS